MADLRRNPQGPQGEQLRRRLIESQRQMQEAQRQAAARNEARLADSRQVSSPGADQGGFNPLDMAGRAFHDFQQGPKIPRPNLAESFIPVVGPAWEAVGDLQDGNYGGAAFNGAMAVADALPLGVAFKGLRAASKGIRLVKTVNNGGISARYAADAFRKAGLKGPGQQLHHVIPLNGIRRNVKNWRNQYPFLKVLPEEAHQRIHRSWNQKPRFDPIRRVWYGTTDWMKAVPTGLAGYAADTWENLTHPFGMAPTSNPPNSSPGGRR